MSTRTSLSLRHAPVTHYTLTGLPNAAGKCVIRDANGKTATVKYSWLDFGGSGVSAGAECWPGSFRTSIHVESADWE